MTQKKQKFSFDSLISDYSDHQSLMSKKILTLDSYIKGWALSFSYWGGHWRIS